MAYLRSQLKHISPHYQKPAYLVTAAENKKKKKILSILPRDSFADNILQTITGNKSPNNQGTSQKIDLTSYTRMERSDLGAATNIEKPKRHLPDPQVLN